MSSGQRPRTREHFPKMKDRAGRRRVRRAEQFGWKLVAFTEAAIGASLSVQQLALSMAAFQAAYERSHERD
ncbi:hypothetical protein C7K25_10315 [Gulosibacter molinativorax]|uniref:Uncharacterized protein n=1 Tax=Gulosibacter molinativorax TaxID=256821 RepID=A0ABT7C620_9MICO|nr:hypothetical protein [Gulosibacter molinativorax]MDJ1371755.1 hypothetical protein [Gulosibacter molinativorax]QUY60880.1 Hypotetical protein [Gulosibacter molinativorax]QUY63336.1 Hypotetical protein [Gulosibacter molinativorax]